MTAKRLLILGGYGLAGRLVARLLLGHTDVELVLAGRSAKRARALADELNLAHPGDRVTAQVLDAADSAALRRAFAAVDYVVMASSTAALAEPVARAALDAGIDYLDLQVSTSKLQALQAMTTEIEAAGRLFITDGGFHPGLPAAMVRYAGRFFDTLESAKVASVIKVDWGTLNVGGSTMEEFVGEFRDYQALAYQDGHWKKAGWLSLLVPKTTDFGPPFGRQYAIPMFLEEMRALPELYPDLEETGFFVGGFNWFVDWVVSPLLMGAFWLAPGRPHRPLMRLMGWGLRTFSRPPYGVVLHLEARGQRDGQRKEAALVLSQADGYLATAIPVVACLKQVLDGSISKRGLWLQAHVVEPERFMADLTRLGFIAHADGLPLPAELPA